MLYSERKFFFLLSLHENTHAHTQKHTVQEMVYIVHFIRKYRKSNANNSESMCRLCIACGTELVEYTSPLMYANGKLHTMERNSSIWFVDKAQCVRVFVSGKEITIRFCDIFSWKLWASFSSSVVVRCSYFGFVRSYKCRMGNRDSRQGVRCTAHEHRIVESISHAQAYKYTVCTVHCTLYPYLSILYIPQYELHCSNHFPHTASVSVCVRMFANRNHVCKIHTHHRIRYDCHSHFVFAFSVGTHAWILNT